MFLDLPLVWNDLIHLIPLILLSALLSLIVVVLIAHKVKLFVPMKMSQHAYKPQDAGVVVFGNIFRENLNDWFLNLGQKKLNKPKQRDRKSVV